MLAVAGFIRIPQEVGEFVVRRPAVRPRRGSVGRLEDLDDVSPVRGTPPRGSSPDMSPAQEVAYPEGFDQGAGLQMRRMRGDEGSDIPLPVPNPAGLLVLIED